MPDTLLCKALGTLSTCLTQSEHSLYIVVEAKQVRVAFRYCISLALSSFLTSNLLLPHLLSACLYLVSTSSALSEGFRREVYTDISLLQRTQLVRIVV